MFSPIARQTLRKCSQTTVKTEIIAKTRPISDWDCENVASTTTTTTTTSDMTAELISGCPKQRERVLECMRKSPPIGIQLRRKEEERRFAAVLIAICTPPAGHGEGASILFTRRSWQLSRHGGQISFPGGIKDPSDRDYIDCALRETEEEIGVPRARFEIWGTGALIKPPHTAAIMPVIGVLPNFSMEELNINEHEVDEVFTIPIAQLMDPASRRHTQFKRGGYSSPNFIVGQYKIWGITGFLTNVFLNCLVPAVENSAHGRRLKYVKPYRPPPID